MNRAVNGQTAVTSSARRADRARLPLSSSKRLASSKCQPPTPTDHPPSSKPSSRSQTETNLDRNWSISSSIVAVRTDFRRPEVPVKVISRSEPAINRLDSRKRPPKKRTSIGKQNVTIRRGPSQASSSKTAPSGALRGASSISSLDSKHKIAPINPLKNSKGGSKDKLDKIQAQKIASQQQNEKNKHDKGIIANNNKLPEPGIDLNPAAVEAIQELEAVHRALEDMAREKAALVLELGNHQTELMALRSEVARLKMYQEQQCAELDQLTDENTTLKCRLRDVAHSPLSDNEKQQLLDTHRQHSSSAPASIAANFQAMDAANNGGDSTACPTPDWDKHSSSSISEVSVACLQDRINQMQETHYSTNEELQATLQELTDLQAQLTELQGENERLSEEKGVLLESLCRQTERLEDSRTEVDTLKQLLYQDRENSSQTESSTDREQKLVDLLKNAQEEREVLLLKQEELNLELQDARQSHVAQLADITRLSERVKLLESTLDATHAERKQLDQELALAKEHSSGRQIEISRLTTLLENARAKIDELEQDRTMSDKSELDELLDNTRKEKDALESQVASLQEQLSLCQCEIVRLKEQISILQEECKVTRNNAKCTQSELEYKCEQLRQEKTNLSTELQALQEACGELQVQAQCHLEDKRQLKALLSETQRHLGDAEGKLSEVEQELDSEKKVRQEENAEWEQFQNDLLMTVRVANDFKTEAQQELQNLVLENKMQKDKVRQLEQQLEKLKVQSAKAPSPPLRQNSVPLDTQHSVLTSVQQEMAVRRQKVGLARQDSRLSVKSLIESIENATKQAKAGPGSRSSSTSSLNSIASDGRSVGTNSTIIGSSSAFLGGPTGPIGSGALSPTSPMRSDWSECVISTNKCPLREQQPNGNNKNSSMNRNNKSIIPDGYGKMDVGKSNSIGKTDDTIRESILQSAKGLDFSRRNSYSDLSERKDPLNGLSKNGGSKRNALLKWCQNKTVGYRNIDITNFSSSWNDGLALCALLHTYLPDRVPYDSLTQQEKRRNFSLAFSAAESVGIPTTLNINDMIQLERPDWQQVMGYVTAIYKHFET